MPLLQWKHDGGVWYLLARIGAVDVAIATVLDVLGDTVLFMTGYKDGGEMPCNTNSTACSFADAHMKIAVLTGWEVPRIDP